MLAEWEEERYRHSLIDAPICIIEPRAPAPEVNGVV
jgi:hypothetical protein